jgi:hypothetical protein
MDEVKLIKGQKVSFTGSNGQVFVGVIEQFRRGWVMLDLEKQVDTGDGWSGNKIMLKSSRCTPAE